MQRTNGLNIECSQLLHNHLYLRTILSADIEIVATSLASPIVSFIYQSSKFAESIGREDHFIRAIVAHDYLWPMYHCSSDKLEFMTTQRECIAILNSYNAPFEVNALEEIRQHFYGWSATYKLQTRIGFQHPCNECSMVGLHMVSHQIIRLATTQCSFQILLPLFTLATVGSIQYCYLLIVNEI